MTLEHAICIRCVAGILVGGASTRMGRPKATLKLPDGQMMIERVAEAVSRAGEWIDEIVVLGDCAELPPALDGCQVLSDAQPGAGPLAGLVRLLEYAGQRWSLLLACDLPLLTSSLLIRLQGAARIDCGAVAFRRMDYPKTWHACCALYHPKLLPIAAAELRHGRRSLQQVLSATEVSSLNITEEEQRMLMNLNTPEDYAQLLQSL